MSVANIVDHRTNRYNVDIDAVFEPAWHDNSIDGSTKFEMNTDFTVDSLENTTIEKAIAYADKFNGNVTIYLYDYGSKPVG